MPALPDHLAQMALFALHTGCRESEITGLRWDEEIRLESGSVFLLEGPRTKNGEERVVVLNSVAQRVIESARGQHPENVFTYRGAPVARMNNSAWRKARKQTGLKQVRIYDLRHTFGRRLRSAGVSHETRKDLLGHKSGEITTHYSQAEIGELRKAVELLCGAGSRKSPAAFLLRTVRSA